MHLSTRERYWLQTEKKTEINVYRNTYPERPTSCVPVKLGAVPYAPVRFKAKRGAFLEAAHSFGIDTTHAEYIEEKRTAQGRTCDLSRLIVRTGPGKEYVYVGFYC